MPFTVPGDTQVPFAGNPAGDTNKIADTINIIGARYNAENTIYAGGADPTGSTDSSPAFAAAIADALSNPGGGTVTFGRGSYLLNSSITALIAPTQTLRMMGAGLRASTFGYTGTGDAIRLRASSYSGGWAQGCELANFTIDGTSAGGGSNGLHIGDINAARVNIQASNFTGAGSSGIFLENTTTWTEQSDIRAILNNCAQAVVFSKSGTGFNSFGYGNYDFTVWTVAPNQDGIVINNGAFVYNSALRARGNFQSSSSALTNAVLRFTNGSHLTSTRLDVQVETPTGTNHPTTIIMDGASAIVGCYGILDFSNGGGTFVPTPAAIGQIGFTGILSGDVNLNPGALINTYVFASVNAPQILSAEINGYHGTGFPTVLADVFTLTLGSNIVANLTSTFYNGTKTLGAPQRVTMIITQAAAGGPFTVTWPNPGSPTTGTPAIKWAGGVAPTMTATAGATDVYDLVTADGIRWYGSARQNVS